MREPEWVGSAFDTAMLSGSPVALLRFRQRVERFHTVVALRASLITSPNRGHAARVLRQREALSALARRGEALAQWHRLTCWLDRVERGVSANAHAAADVRRLRKRAAHRRAKSANRYRLWLSQPACRRHRNTVVRALSRTPSWTVKPVAGAGAFSRFVAITATLNRDDWDAVDAASRTSAGWAAVGAPVDATKRVEFGRMHRALLRQRTARHLAERLQQLGDSAPALSRTVARLQSQLTAHGDAGVDAVWGATVTLQLPLRARFAAGVASSAAAG
ncbi:MAG: hypothetical protein AAF460_11430 [Pseudomonadota bacterium]